MSKREGKTVKKSVSPEEWVAEYLKESRNGKQASMNLKPHLTELSAEVDASRMLSKDKTQALLNDIDDYIKLGAYKGVKKAIDLIDSDNEQVSTKNIWNLIEHAKGKATQKTEVHSKSVSVSIDLTGQQ